MALLWRIVELVLRTALRAGALFLVLFVAYLAVTEAWPAYRALSSVAAQRPALEQEMMRLESELSRRQWRADQLRKQLEELVANELLGLRQNVASFESAVSDADQRRQKLQQDLTDVVAQETEYCTSWNPLKRWACSEVRERAARTRGAIEPLLQDLGRSRETLLRELSAAGDALRRYESLTPEQRGSTLDAQRVRAELGEQLYESEKARETISHVKARLDQAKWAEASPWVWASRQLRRVAFPLGVIVAGVMIAPWLQRVVLYFGVMPLVSRARPLRLTEACEGKLEAGKSDRAITVRLALGERCFARAGYVRPVAGMTRSVWLYDWRAPLVSYASGLSVLTRIDGPSASDSAPVEATLASPAHTESHLLEVLLDAHPGFVFHPRHLVSVTGHLELTTVWRLFSVHAWMTGQIRYILVKGTGRCVFEGFGDIRAEVVQPRPSRIEQELVVGFDARLLYSTARTETFLPYLLGRTPLVDDVFSGSGVYLWQKNTRSQPRSFAERSFELLFGALGKLLGF